MCGRYVMPNDDAIGEYWAVSCRIWLSTLTPRFNVAPTAQVPILVRAREGACEALTARWGLIPRWWTSDAPPAQTFNARAEDAARKPVFRECLRASRCLVPAQGWYEWAADEPPPNRTGRPTRHPFFLHCPGEPVIAFAGLWSRWERPGSTPVLSCAILTRKASPDLAAIHPRMPVALHRDRQAAWLDPCTPADTLQTILASSREDVEAYPVGPRVNDARNDGPELMERAARPSTGLLDFGAPEA